MELNLKYCFPTKDIFGHVYKKPHSMHEGDFNGRILHGAISTAKLCFRSEYERSDLCPDCGKHVESVIKHQ